MRSRGRRRAATWAQKSRFVRSAIVVPGSAVTRYWVRLYSASRKLCEISFKNGLLWMQKCRHRGTLRGGGGTLVPRRRMPPRSLTVPKVGRLDDRRAGRGHRDAAAESG